MDKIKIFKDLIDELEVVSFYGSKKTTFHEAIHDLSINEIKATKINIDKFIELCRIVWSSSFTGESWSTERNRFERRLVILINEIQH